NYRVTSETVDGANAVAFQYDRDGLPTRAGALTLNRDSQNGRLTSTTLGTVGDRFTYNNFGEVTGYEADARGIPRLTLQDTPDGLGRISQRTETIAGVTHTYVYSYDVDGRLTGVQQDGTTVSQYTYDGNGNRRTHTTPGG